MSLLSRVRVRALRQRGVIFASALFSCKRDTDQPALRSHPAVCGRYSAGFKLTRPLLGSNSARAFPMTARSFLMSRFPFPLILLMCLPLAVVFADDAAPIKWLPATAYAVPKETTNQGSGYFSIVTGRTARQYIGPAKYGVNAFLVEFDPSEKRMEVVVDTQKEIGTSATGFAAQSKIHTRNNVGASGRIYFATKQGYPEGRSEEHTSELQSPD